MDDEKHGQKRYNLRNGPKAANSSTNENNDAASAEKPSSDDSRGKSTATKPKPKSTKPKPTSTSTKAKPKPAATATKSKGASARNESIDRSDEDQQSPPPNDHRRINRARPQGAGVLVSPSSKVRDICAQLLVGKERNAMKLQDVLDQAHTLTDKIDLLIELRKLDEDGLAELTFSSLQIDGGITIRRDRDVPIERGRGAGVQSANDAESPVSNGGDFDVSMRSVASPIGAEGFDYDFDDDQPTPPIPPRTAQQQDVPEEVEENSDVEEPPPPPIRHQSKTKAVKSGRIKCRFCVEHYSDRSSTHSHEMTEHGISCALLQSAYFALRLKDKEWKKDLQERHVVIHEVQERFIDRNGQMWRLFTICGEDDDRTKFLQQLNLVLIGNEQSEIQKILTDEEDVHSNGYSKKLTKPAMQSFVAQIPKNNAS